MTRADLIREHMRQVGAVSEESARPRLQIREAMGLTRDQLSSSIDDLRRLGYVKTVGAVGSQRYYLTGKVPPVPMTDEQFRAKEIARQEVRRRKAGKVTRAEYLAAFQAKAEAKAAAKAANKAKREAKRLAAEQKRRITARIEAKRTAKRVAKVRAAVEVGCRFTSIAPVKTVEAWPSSEDFIKAGGVVQVLTNGEVSKPFRAIGFNNRRAAA